MNKWIFFILILVSTTIGSADTIVLKNQKTFQDAWVISFKTDPKEGPVVLSHIAEEKKLSDEAYPLTTDQIAGIKFNWIGKDGLSTNSRQANMTLKNGKSYKGVSVSHAEATENKFGFYIRTAESEETSDFFFFPASDIETLYMFPVKPPVEMCFNAELGNFYMRQGALHWELNADEIKKLNKLSPQEVEKIPGINKGTMNKLAQAIFAGQVQTAWNGMTRRQYKKWNAPKDQETEETEETAAIKPRRPRRAPKDISIDDHLGMLAQKLQENRMTGSNLQGLMDSIDTQDMAGDGYSGDSGSFVTTLAGASFLLILLINTVYLCPSLLILKFICMVENIKDVRWKNLAICALSLAFIPLLITYPSYSFVLRFIPGYGWIFALFLYLFISRNIVMGCMEIFEGQAWAIVIVDLLVRIGLVLLIISFFAPTF